MPATGSGVNEPTVAVFVSDVPAAMPAGRRTVSVSSAVAPSTISGLVHVRVLPVPQVKPCPSGMATYVAPVGSTSASVTPTAGVGPSLCTSTRKSTSAPATAWPTTVVATPRLADGFTYSYAPMSQCSDRGRERPRWSTASQVASSPAS